MLLNVLADGAADWASSRLQPPDELIEQARLAMKRAGKLARRYALLLAKHWQALDAQPWYDQPVLDMQVMPTEWEYQAFIDKIQENGHVLQSRGKWLECRRCGRQRLKSNRSFWIKARCDGAVSKRYPEPRRDREDATKRQRAEQPVSSTGAASSSRVTSGAISRRYFCPGCPATPIGSVSIGCGP